MPEQQELADSTRRLEVALKLGDAGKLDADTRALLTRIRSWRQAHPRVPTVDLLLSYRLQRALPAVRAIKTRRAVGRGTARGLGFPSPRTNPDLHCDPSVRLAPVARHPSARARPPRTRL
jgi:hypothetical protein